MQIRRRRGGSGRRAHSSDREDLHEPVDRQPRSVTERPEDEPGVAPLGPGWIHRHGYRLLVLALLATFLACFAVAEALRLPLLSESGIARPPSQVPTAAFGLALLISDVVLPVPSSAVMVAQGAAYGLILGALLGWLGSTGATVVAYALGRASRRWVHRLAAPEEQRRAADLVRRHGAWAVTLSRPVPMVAETVGIIAGVERLPWWRVVLAGAAGNVVPAVAYAAVGALAATMINGLVVFAAVLVLTGLGWLLQLRRRPSLTPADGAEHDDQRQRFDAERSQAGR